jgi:hypothetical protein
MINSTDHIKSNGFIPWPGSTHYSGERYEPVLHADGNWHLIEATPWLIAAILADQADEKARRGWKTGGLRGSGGCSSPGLKTGGRRGGGGGDGGGHDDEISSRVMSMILSGLRGDLDKEQVYEQWRQIAVPRNPADPFTREDFERHYGNENRGALRKAREIWARDEQLMNQATRWLERSRI